MKAYKVVRPDKQGRLWSWFYSEDARDALARISVRYQPGQYVKPKVKRSRLMVFRDRADALAFAHHGNQVWLCEAEDARGVNFGGKKMSAFQVPPWILGLTRETCARFWQSCTWRRDGRTNESRLTYDNWPRGTLFAKRVKLLGRVDQ